MHFLAGNDILAQKIPVEFKNHIDFVIESCITSLPGDPKSVIM